jgi:hypothetical protein
MSELAQELIKARAHAQGWSIQSYPGKVKLPADILKPLPSAEEANKVFQFQAQFALGSADLILPPRQDLEDCILTG